MGSMTANEIISLKTKVKAEMQRRSGYGSLASFGGDSYEFNIAPSSGELIKADHGQKIINPLLEIADISGLKQVN